MSETAVEPLGQKPDPLEEAHDALAEPSTDTYHNPREQSSRMGLEARAYAFRAGASLAFGMGNMVPPSVPSATSTVYLDSTLSKKYPGKEKIRCYVWTPDRPRAVSRKSSRDSVKSIKKEEKNRLKAERKEEKRREKEAKKESKKCETVTEDDEQKLNPPLSRTSTADSTTDVEAATSSALGGGSTPATSSTKRPSTLKRLSSRMSAKSTKSSKSIKSSLSRSASNLSLSSTASTNSQTSLNENGTAPNPMSQIPSLLTPQADPKSRRPAVINFHGGGFVLGQGTDDGRWAMAVMQALGAVFFSVEYRLAPSYPFPTPVEDCADAILQITRRADEFWIDPDKIMVTGFSAGGTLALASWVLLADPQRWGYDIKAAPNDLANDVSKMSVNGKDSSNQEKPSQDGEKMNKTTDYPQPAGLMLFYPLLDWTQSRPRKRLTCSKPELTLGRTLTDLFDASYLYPYDEVKSQLDNPLLSPGLMPDDLIDKLPPVQLCLCEYDMLLAEGRRFQDRLKQRGKTVGAREVPGARHAWDKPNGLLYSPPESMGREYAESVRVMAGWIGREEGNGSAESLEKRESELQGRARESGSDRKLEALDGRADGPGDGVVHV